MLNRKAHLLFRISPFRLHAEVYFWKKVPRLFSTETPAEVESVSTEIKPVDEEDSAEIKLIRNKSRMRPHIRKEYFELDPGPLYLDRQYRMKILRSRYAKYGNVTRLNPGICYPTREELLENIEYDNLASPNLFEALAEAKAKRQEKEDYVRNREQQILTNMVKLEKWKKEMEARETKRQKLIDEQTAKKDRLIEEVQEYLGYHVEPTDPKFQEMLEKKEDEITKAAKVARKKEKHEQMLAKIISIGESFQKTQAEKAEATERSSTTTESDDVLGEKKD